MNNDRSFNWSHIEPLCLLRAELRGLWLTVLAALTGAMAAWLILSAFASPAYSSGIILAVTSRSGASTYYANSSAATQVASIYSELLQSSIMDDAVKQSLNGGTPGKITAKQLGDTNLISVTATSASPREAFLTIEAVMDNYRQMSDYVSSTAVLSLLSSPRVSTVPSNSYDRAKVCALAAAVCAAALILLVGWCSAARGSVQNSASARDLLDAKVLAAIPHQGPRGRRRLKRGRVSPLITSPTVSFGFAESIHQISARLENERAGGRRVFMFTSVTESEGKSTVASNTALSLSQSSQRVLFIDLDLRRPVQSRVLGVSAGEKSEFGELLRTGAPAEKILSSAVPIGKNISALLSSKSYVDSIGLLSSPLLAQTVKLAAQRYDYIVIDSPPLGYFSDSEVLSDMADASILVVRQDVVPAEDINDAADSLRAGKAAFLGCILNDMRSMSRGASYGYGYGYRYYGKYGKYGYGSHDA